MSTFALFWNPAISSWKLENHREFLRARPCCYSLNWSIWEHDKAGSGDRFVMVRCKNKPVPGKVNKYGRPLWEPCVDASTGICIVGTFLSDPYLGEDWSGKGRETYYVDLDIEQMSDPDECVIIGTRELIAKIPEFDWKGGHSGRMLDEASELKLESMLAASVDAKKDLVWSPDRRVFID